MIVVTNGFHSTCNASFKKIFIIHYLIKSVTTDKTQDVNNDRGRAADNFNLIHIIHLNRDEEN